MNALANYSIQCIRKRIKFTNTLSTQMISRAAVPRECYIRYEIFSPFPGLNKYRPVAFGALGDRIKNVFIIIEMFSRTDRAAHYSPLVQIRGFIRGGSLCCCIIDALLNKVYLAKAFFPDPLLFNISTRL